MQAIDEATGGMEASGRLYQQVAQRLFDQLADGKFAIGERLPPERDMVAEYRVSRPTIREAIIALEVQGLVEVRVGSGAYVLRLPGQSDRPGFHVTAFELTEARLAIEGEAAALAAIHITDEELTRLVNLLTKIARYNQRGESCEGVDREFHLVIARATRNAAMVNVIDHLWDLRVSSPDTKLLLAKARAAKIKPVIEEHRAIIVALKSRDPEAARSAMRSHLAAVLDHLLFATEEAAVEEARRVARRTRERYLGTTCQSPLT